MSHLVEWTIIVGTMLVLVALYRIADILSRIETMLSERLEPEEDEDLENP